MGFDGKMARKTRGWVLSKDGRGQADKRWVPGMAEGWSDNEPLLLPKHAAPKYLKGSIFLVKLKITCVQHISS